MSSSNSGENDFSSDMSRSSIFRPFSVQYFMIERYSIGVAEGAPLRVR